MRLPDGMTIDQVLRADEVLVSWDEFDELAASVAIQILNSGVQYDVILIIKHGASHFGASLERIMVQARAEYARFKREETGLTEEDSPPPKIVYFPTQESLQDMKIMLLDEVWETGKTVVRAIQEINQPVLGLEAALVDVAVLHYKPTCNIYPHRKPKYFGAEIDARYRCYPWELWERVVALTRQRQEAAASA